MQYSAPAVKIVALIIGNRSL